MSPTEYVRPLATTPEPVVGQFARAAAYNHCDTAASRQRTSRRTHNPGIASRA
jgi:hypothetical protein